LLNLLAPLFQMGKLRCQTQAWSSFDDLAECVFWGLRDCVNWAWEDADLEMTQVREGVCTHRSLETGQGMSHRAQ
jgi:hypothetical protein